MDGDGTYNEINNAQRFGSLIHFQFLGIQTIIERDRSELPGFSRAWAFRRISISRRASPIHRASQFRRPNARSHGSASRTTRCMPGVSVCECVQSSRSPIIADAEIGRADRPIYPTSEKNYHALGGRIRYKTRSFAFGAQRSHELQLQLGVRFSRTARRRVTIRRISHGRAQASWIGIDASYSKLHLDTLSGIAYFFNNAFVQNDQSRYISNIHVGNDRSLRVFVRDSTSRSVRRICPYAGRAAATRPSLGRLDFQIYPLTFDSPMGRVSVRLA